MSNMFSKGLCLPSVNLRRRQLILGSVAAGCWGMGLCPTILRAASMPLEKELSFACNGGVQEPMFRAIGSSFEKATGVKVNYVIGTQLSHMAKIQASRDKPDIDALFGSDLTHAAGKIAGLFEKLNPSVVDTRDIYPSALDPDGIGVSCSLTSIGIGYNTEKFKQAGIPAPTSWFDLWDPRLKGRVAICNFSVSWIHDFLALMSRLTGGSEKNIQPAIAKIKELKTMGNLVYQPNSPAELENLLTQDLAWVTVTASIRSYQLQDAGYPFDFVFPKEGASNYANWLDVIRNAPHPNAAQAFVSHMLAPEAQLILSGGLYGPTNKTIVLPPALASKSVYGEERINSLVTLDRITINADLDKWHDTWAREIERN